MPVVQLNFTGQSYTERSRQANAQECVNLYPVKSPSADDPNRVVLYPAPGFQYLQDLPWGACRGTYDLNGVVYGVFGSKFVRLVANAGGTYDPTVLGTLYTAIGRCSLAGNDLDIAVSDGTYGYCYNLAANSFAGVAGWPSQGVTNLTHQDGYIVAAVKGTSRLVQSALRNASSWPAANYYDVSGFSDALTAVYSDGRQLLAFGPKQGQALYNAGNTAFAFERTQGVVIEAGVVSWATMQRVGGALVWLASDAQGRAFVAGLDGYQPEPLSHPPLDEALQRYPTVADATASAYREAGGRFYLLSVGGDTWAYDPALKAWHTRTYPAARPDFLVPAGTRQLALSDKLYAMSQDSLTDGAGAGLVRRRTCAHLGSGGKLLAVQDVEIDVETGLSDTAGLATLELSVDEGVTWTSGGTKPIGGPGQTRQRLIWRGLGFGRTLTFRFTVTDPVRVYVLGARLRANAASR